MRFERQAQIDALHGEHFPPEEEYKYTTQASLALWKPRPDVNKVKKIADWVTYDLYGELTLHEVKKLFSAMLDVMIDDIPDEHSEVLTPINANLTPINALGHRLTPF